VFCFLINRVRFCNDQNLTTTPLSQSRATLCEILAIRTMRIYADSLLDLALAITTSWPVYIGCDPSILESAREERDDDIEETVGNAIELAIISRAKRFIKSSPCQRVIDAIWRCGIQPKDAEPHQLVLQWQMRISGTRQPLFNLRRKSQQVLTWPWLTPP